MQGMPFLGSSRPPPREYVYGFRDRMDERYDMIRSVRDKRYKYIRNYRPDLPYFHDQHVSYMYEMPTMKAWQRLADAGKLTGRRRSFMAKRSRSRSCTTSRPTRTRSTTWPAIRSTRRRSTGCGPSCGGWQEEIVDLGLLARGRPADAVR